MRHQKAGLYCGAAASITQFSTESDGQSAGALHKMLKAQRTEAAEDIRDGVGAASGKELLVVRSYFKMCKIQFVNE